MNPSLHLSQVTLRVRDLRVSRDYYTRLGFVVARESDAQADLSTSRESPSLLTLLAGPDAPAAPRDAAGLFHAALLLPSRDALATWLALAAAQHIEFEGFSDHGVSEAIYLSDPDGNGLEFYADRPRSLWPFRDGELAMITRPLAVRELLTHATPSATPLAGSRWGHLHLRVTALERSEEFYRETLGLAVTQRSYPGARFLAADGYHHHLGLNTWGNPSQPRPSTALGLVSATFEHANTVAPKTVADPDGIALRVTPALAARVGSSTSIKP